ncbi:MAG TPA: hypothetical protein VHS99_26100 [Chloroflexota bacterium]|nr:hypothetical protein [Chloroflexota bacterium]
MQIAIIGAGNVGEALAGSSTRARVVEAFNTAFATRMADPRVDGVPLDGFVAGDDAEAIAAVLSLVGAIGFRPIDVGPLPWRGRWRRWRCSTSACRSATTGRGRPAGSCSDRRVAPSQARKWEVGR